MSGCSERWTAAVVFLALFVCVTSPLPAGPLPATGVLDALAEPDGSAVSLKAVSVQKTASDPIHIVISDPWAGDHDASPTPSEPPAASYRRNNSNRYIVLVTDAAYHHANDGYGYTVLTEQQVISALQSCGAKVYVSLWEELGDWRWANWYSGLAVNGANDPTSFPVQLPAAWRYPLSQLRASVLSNWP